MPKKKVARRNRRTVTAEKVTPSPQAWQIDMKQLPAVPPPAAVIQNAFMNCQISNLTIVEEKNGE